jgi:hypothetical protein
MNDLETLAGMLAGDRAEGQDAIAWAATPSAKAQYQAALDVSRRLGVPVTGAQLCAMLWAAHKAA